MIEDIFVAILVLSMFAVSYILTYLPLLIKSTASASHSQHPLTLLLAAFGAGLLLGTDLIIVMPEGISALFSSQLDVHDHHSHH